ncbi:hypothetical protein TNCV_4192891, partial [Trichonephila clavipes]
MYAAQQKKRLSTLALHEHFLRKKDDSSDLSTDDIFSESSESEDGDISSARMWVEEKTVCPATPRFDFTESPGIL